MGRGLLVLLAPAIGIFVRGRARLRFVLLVVAAARGTLQPNVAVNQLLIRLAQHFARRLVSHKSAHKALRIVLRAIHERGVAPIDDSGALFAIDGGLALDCSGRLLLIIVLRALLLTLEHSTQVVLVNVVRLLFEYLVVSLAANVQLDVVCVAIVSTGGRFELLRHLALIRRQNLVDLGTRHFVERGFLTVVVLKNLRWDREELLYDLTVDFAGLLL